MSARGEAPLGAATKRRGRLEGLRPRRIGPIATLGGRSRLFVALMRFGLPALALALLLLVVVWPLATGNQEGFRLSFIEGGPLDAGPLRMVNARYLGADEQNQSYTVTADQALQETAEADLVTLINPKADITLKDNGWLALTAERGLYHRAAQVLELEGRVNAFSDSGFEMRTERARIELGKGTAEGHEPVEGQGPLGVLNAAGFRLIDEGQRIHFEGPVKLVIYPAVEEGA